MLYQSLANADEYATAFLYFVLGAFDGANQQKLISILVNFDQSLSTFSLNTDQERIPAIGERHEPYRDGNLVQCGLCASTVLKKVRSECRHIWPRFHMDSRRPSPHVPCYVWFLRLAQDHRRSCRCLVESRSLGTIFRASVELRPSPPTCAQPYPRSTERLD